MLAKSSALQRFCKLVIMFCDVLFKSLRVSSLILSRISPSIALMILSFNACLTPYRILYWEMSSLCNASSLAHVPAAALSANPAG